MSDITKTMNGPGDREWRDDRKLVLWELDNLRRTSESLADKLESNRTKLESRIGELHTDIVQLKTKATAWGSIAGIVAGLVASIAGDLWR